MWAAMELTAAIPGATHGCIRTRNPDILRLARFMPIGVLRDRVPTRALSPT
jgi:hypothetical protein